SATGTRKHGAPRGATRIRLHPIGQGEIEEGSEKAGDQVAQEQRRISDVPRKARQERPCGRGAVSDEVVGAERQSSSVGPRRLGKHGLLQGEEGADLSRPDGHVTDDARERRSPPAGGGKEEGSRDRVGEAAGSASGSDCMSMVDYAFR